MSLFTYARDRHDGRPIVADVGAFAVHHKERVQGVLTESLRDWFSILQFHQRGFQLPGVVTTTDALPAVTPEYLLATIRRTDHKTINEALGLKLSHAVKMVPEIIQHLDKNSDGTYALRNVKTQKHYDLFMWLCSNLVVKSAYVGNDLSKALLSILRSSGNISADEIRMYSELADYIQLFTIAVMHNSNIILQDKSQVKLQASLHDDVLTVQAPLEIPNLIGGMPIIMSAAVFSTDLKTQDCCEPDVFEHPDPSKYLELMPSGKLGYLE